MTRSLRPTLQIPLATSLDAHQVQTEGLRRMGGQGRSACMCLAGSEARRPVTVEEEASGSTVPLADVAGLVEMAGASLDQA